MNRKYFLIGFVVVAVLLLIAIWRMNIMVSESQKPQPIPGPNPIETQTPPSSGAIVGSWQWTKTQMSDGKVTSPDKPGVFVATFNVDNTMSSTTDCNTIGGDYKLLPNNGIKFSDLSTTLMFCENSQEGEYMQALQSANRYKTSGNELWLMLPYDSGTMVFEKKD